MQLTAEELAIYGLIDADTYIQLTEAIIAGTADASTFRLRLSAKVRRRIRQRGRPRRGVDFTGAPPIGPRLASGAIKRSST